MTGSTVSEGGGLPLPSPLSPAEAADLARRHGLTPLAGRPRLRSYVAQVWERRQFILTLSSGQSTARYQSNRLGQLWSLLNPALLVVSYFLIFGVLLRTSRGVDNFVGFLSIGVVLFGFSAAVIGAGSKALSSNVALVRALRFPRAALPISVAMTELIAALPALGLLLVLMPVLGEPIRVQWLLLPVSVLLQVLQITGLSLVGARLVDISRDLANLIPLFLRISRYLSGVFFSIATFSAGFPEPVGAVLRYQPFAVQLETARQSLMAEFPFEPQVWLASAGWSVGLFVVGFVVFWRGEGSYGRG
ncbi:ABC transporter permease [Phycicoccus sp. CSK15P-2]|uniref:ABC transporter permease n=1 Tax=Phycicoccus sp. CSK15P-2 TaxID=2807627 RepID=UPI00194FE8F7|nr:ABC transporter permease [Phycicoccus sp. CSK15P-2]MBM6402949.1 ABC transporter permease [Phycicoccus sp. CSK15P-2]